MKKAGIEVEVLKEKSELGQDIRELNQPFIKWAKYDFPYIVLKSGLSLDGKIATSSGESKWITSDASRKDARGERSRCDAVLVGSGTVKADDPELAAHGKHKNKDLLRIVVDRKLSLDPKMQVFRDQNVLVVCTDKASKSARAKYLKAGVPFKSFGKDEISLKRLLKYLAKDDVQSVFVEGGSAISGLFYDAASKDEIFIDKVIYYYSPILIGGQNAKSVVGGNGAESLKKALKLADYEVEVVDEDLKLVGKVNQY